MSEPVERNPFALPSVSHPRVPLWLANRVLRSHEQVTWVRGPWLNPWWERHVTNPMLFLFALALGGAWLMADWLRAGSVSDISALTVLAAGGIVLASVYVLAFFSGYFTRMVVTDSRLLIVQGYEVRRSWNIDELPPSLVRYARRSGKEERPTVNLEALHTMMGGTSAEFADSKTIQAFGLQLEQIKRGRNEGC